MIINNEGNVFELKNRILQTPIISLNYLMTEGLSMKSFRSHDGHKEIHVTKNDRFSIRWEMAKVLMQNASLCPVVKMNKKIIVEAILTAIFLSEKGKSTSINELFFGPVGKEKVEVKHFVEWCNEITSKMMVGYALNQPNYR